MLAYSLHACALIIIIALASLHLHTCTCITLAYFDTCMLCTWLLSLFHWGTYSVHVVVQVWWKCQCVSVSVEVSVFKGFSGRTLRNAFGKNGGFPWFLLCGKEKIVNSCIGRFFNINCLTYPQHRPNIASKMAQRGANIGQHGANIRQHRPNLGQHKPNIGQPRPNIGSTWAEDVPNIGHMGPTWPNLGPRCAPDSLTTLFNIIGPTKSQKERERERQDPALRHLAQPRAKMRAR